MKLVWFFVPLLCLLHEGVPEQENADITKQDGSNDKCIVRDGRDGLPGPPGLPGHPGNPGRDGRDCFNCMKLARAYEIENRLRKLDKRCQVLEKEADETEEAVLAYRNLTSRLLKIMLEKRYLDKDILREASKLQILVNQKMPKTEKSRGDATTQITPEYKTTSQVAKNEYETFYAVAKRISKYRPTLKIPFQEMTKPTFFRVEDHAKKACPKRFHVYQEIRTQGAVSVDVFVIGNVTYLAVANFHHFKSKTGYHTNSFVYRMNPDTKLFELFQELPTIGCRALIFFTDGADSHLIAANHYDGVRYDLNSIIFKWNGTRFVKFRKVPTSGGTGAQVFTIAGESYLVMASYRNKTTVSVSSVVYKWKEGRLEMFQRLKTHGAVDCKFYRRKSGEAFLVFANYYTTNKSYNVQSSVFKWNGKRFVPLQNIKTSAAHSVDMFEQNGVLFLALASHRTSVSWHSNSNIFRWTGNSFVLFQEISTTAASKIRHFFDENGVLYLVIANYFDEITNFDAPSMVFKFQEGTFVKYQAILTTGAYDLRPFIYEGTPYLAAAFRFDGERSTLRSKIYKMTTSCKASKYVLP